MNIDEKIRLEEERHYEKIKKLNEILKMYNNSKRDYSTYVERNVDQAVNYGVNSDRIVSYEESRQNIIPYAKQIEEIESEKEKENDFYKRNIAYLAKQKEEIEQQKMKEEIAKEQEKQQKEIELLTLQQEINKIENEKIEIEKRIRQISSETLGSFFTEQVSEKYPTEYQTFKQQEEQARNHRSSYAKITDLKEKFNEVSQDLQFYQGALPVYESFYQRFEQMKTERQQAQVDEREQERIYNLIHKAENERLQRSRSLYTAWDLGNKTIPPEYQGMTYEQVEAILNQKGAEEKQRQEAKATRDELIGKAIRKDLNVPEDYHLSQIQIQNLSQQFAGYSDDELREFTSDVKKQETTPEGKQETSTPTTSYNEFEKNLVDFIERKNFSLGKVAEVLSVTGYPDPTFEVKFEDGTIHKITITHEEEMNLNVPKKESKLLIEKEQKHDLEQSKQNLINQIITAMTNAGEFNFGDPLNIIGKMNAMENVKNNLNAKTIEELQFILSIYSDSYEKTESNGMHI